MRIPYGAILANSLITKPTKSSAQMHCASNNTAWWKIRANSNYTPLPCTAVFIFAFFPSTAPRFCMCKFVFFKKLLFKDPVSIFECQRRACVRKNWWQGGKKFFPLGENPVPVLLNVPQIPHDLAYNWTRGSANNRLKRGRPYRVLPWPLCIQLKALTFRHRASSI